MTHQAFDRDGLQVMTAAECFRLLTTQPVGRLVYHDGGLPAVRLVNFVVDQGAVLFRTGGGQTFLAAERGEVVAFEVDDFDIDRQLGWTVTAMGHLELVTAAAELERIRGLPLRPWAPGERPNLVRLDVESITGRRLVPWAQRPDSTDHQRSRRV
jgi:nitroimidazol reductase NimA-like FMN-containing flavoprotein (pyridoxamine 5'-phosphate oxidase superfamily)